jgi:hypothetical protein
MVEISCFYMHSPNEPIIFTFMKYEKFIKIILNHKEIVLEIENMKYYEMIYQFYFVSLVVFKSISIENDRYISYAFTTNHSNCRISTIIFNKNVLRNLFQTQEPKRETSVRKQVKFIRMINKFYYDGLIYNPLFYIERFIYNSTNKIIDYENKIYILCCIRGFNKDIYSNIMRYM